MSSRRMLAATILPITSGDQHAPEADLFAFPGIHENTTVIALTAPESTSRSEIRIHAGSGHWVFETDGSKSYGFPAFCGKVLTGPPGRTQVRDAVVIQIPNRMLAGVERAGIWAEQFSASGDRRRIVMMNNEKLARDYHAIGPSQDREVLLEGVAEAVAAGVRNRPQVGNPLAYGRRLRMADGLRRGCCRMFCITILNCRRGFPSLLETVGIRMKTRRPWWERC